MGTRSCCARRMGARHVRRMRVMVGRSWNAAVGVSIMFIVGLIVQSGVVDALVASEFEAASGSMAAAIGSGSIASGVVYVEEGTDDLMVSLSLVLIPTAVCVNVSANEKDSIKQVVLVDDNDEIWWTFCDTAAQGASSNISKCDPIPDELFSTLPTYAGTPSFGLGTDDQMLNVLFGSPTQFAIRIDTDCAFALNGNTSSALLRSSLDYGTLFAASSLPDARLLSAPSLTIAPSDGDANETAAVNASAVGSSTGRIAFGSLSAGELTATLSLFIEQTEVCANALGLNYSQVQQTGEPLPVVRSVDIFAANNNGIDDQFWWRICGLGLGDGSTACAALSNSSATTETYVARPQQIAGLTPAQMLSQLYANPSAFYASVSTDCSDALHGRALIRSTLELMFDPTLLESASDLEQLESSQPAGLVPLSLAGFGSYASAIVTVSSGGIVSLDPAWALQFEDSACAALGVASGAISSIVVRRGGVDGTDFWGYCGFESLSSPTRECPAGLVVSSSEEQVLVRLSDEATVADLYRRPGIYSLVVNTACEDVTANVQSAAAPALFTSKLLSQRYYFCEDVSAESASTTTDATDSGSSSSQGYAQVRVAPTGAIAVVFHYALADADFEESGIRCDAGFEQLAIGTETGDEDSILFCDTSVNGSAVVGACPSSNEERVEYVAMASTAQAAMFRELAIGAGNPELRVVRSCVFEENDTAVGNTSLAGSLARLVTISIAEMQPNPVTDPDVLPDAAGDSTARAAAVFDAGNQARSPMQYALEDNTTTCAEAGQSSQRMVSFSLNAGASFERGDDAWVFCDLESTNPCPSALEGDQMFVGMDTAVSQQETGGRASMTSLTLDIVQAPENYYVQVSTECSDAFRAGSSLLRAQLGGEEVPTPTPFPPNNLPTISPEPSASPSPEGNPCFPGDAVVELEDGTSKLMRQLELGDRVRVSTAARPTTTATTSFSDVFFFGHRVERAKAEYVVLEIARALDHDGGDDHHDHRDRMKLVLSADHYLYSNGVLTAADRVAKGDIVHLKCVDSATPRRDDGGDGVKEEEDACSGRVERIWTEQRQGLYSPHTLHGDIVVNGVLASSYTRLVPVALTKAMLLPLRLLYHSGARSAFGLLRILDDDAPRLARLARTYTMPLSSH